MQDYQLQLDQQLAKVQAEQKETAADNQLEKWCRDIERILVEIGQSCRRPHGDSELPIGDAEKELHNFMNERKAARIAG